MKINLSQIYVNCDEYYGIYCMNNAIRHTRYALDTDRYQFFGIPIFSKNFHRYLVSCRYSTGHRYQYSKIRLPIFVPML